MAKKCKEFTAACLDCESGIREDTHCWRCHQDNCLKPDTTWKKQEECICYSNDHPLAEKGAINMFWNPKCNAKTHTSRSRNDKQEEVKEIEHDDVDIFSCRTCNLAKENNLEILTQEGFYPKPTLEETEKEFDEKFFEYDGRWQKSDKNGNSDKVISIDIKSFYRTKFTEIINYVIGEMEGRELDDLDFMDIVERHPDDILEKGGINRFRDISECAGRNQKRADSIARAKELGIEIK